MSELLIIFDNLNNQHPELITWGVVVLFIFIGISLQSAYLKECITEWKLNRLLNNLGRESLHYVTIPDGLDGSIFIEHLILTPNGIVLLGVKKYKGVIFAADKIDLWTQVIGNKSYKFVNPLHQLEADVLALNSLIDNSKIETKVLFISGSEFPKGKPENVVSVSEIQSWRRAYTVDEIPNGLRTDWKRLLDIASKDDSINTYGAAIDPEGVSGMNLYSLVAVLAAISLWLVWRLNF